MYKSIYSFSKKGSDWLDLEQADQASLTGPDTPEAKRILGGKGAALVTMIAAGMPVPPGFTITTEVCNIWRATLGDEDTPEAEEKQHKFMEDLLDGVMVQYEILAEKFDHYPLVSVRSGAPISMPGMMDTILNVGLTTETLPEWKQRIGARAALDSYRRLIQMLGSTAYGIDMALFDEELNGWKKKAGVSEDKELSLVYMEKVVKGFKIVFAQETGRDFPDTVEGQLVVAIMAVFSSWMNPRAIAYREMNSIPEDMGTAVTIQAMVFGNMGETSGSGVLFTRNPSTGEKEIMAEYLANAQGEDVVAGIRTPDHLSVKDIPQELDALGWIKELFDYCADLETAYADMVDVEFTVQEGELFILQSRAGKRSARAAIKIAYDLVNEGVVDRETALSRLTVDQYKIARLPGIDPAYDHEPHLIGLPACPGVVTGRPVFSAQEAVDCDEPCILITHETTPDDIAGMNAAVGILTQTGGATSHAAVVARAMDTPCIVGCTDLELAGDSVLVNGVPFDQDALSGYKVTIDGSTGRVWFGADVPLIDTSDSEELLALGQWCMDLGKCEPVTLVEPDIAGSPAHIACSEWWGDFDLFTIVLDGLGSWDDFSMVTLDMRSPRELVPSDDHQLLDLFQMYNPDEDTFFDAMVEYLLAQDNLEGLRLKVEGATSTTLSALRAAGYIVPIVPQTVADLMSSFTVEPTIEFVNTVVGGHDAMKQLTALLKLGGFEMRTPKRAVPVDYAVFQQLKQN